MTTYPNVLNSLTSSTDRDVYSTVIHGGNTERHLRASGHAGSIVVSTRPENGVI